MPRSKFSDHTPEEWIEMWEADRRSTLATMYRNLTADTEAGYCPWGYSMRLMQYQITEFTTRWESKTIELSMISELDTNAKARKCFKWLKESGAIE